MAYKVATFDTFFVRVGKEFSLSFKVNDYSKIEVTGVPDWIYIDWDSDNNELRIYGKAITVSTHNVNIDLGVYNVKFKLVIF